MLEDGKYYPVLHVVHGLPNYMAHEEDALLQMRQFFPDREMAQEMADQYGLYLIIENHPTLRQLLERDLKQKEKIAQSLQGCMGQQQRLWDVEQRKEAIRRLIQMMEGNCSVD